MRLTRFKSPASIGMAFAVACLIAPDAFAQRPGGAAAGGTPGGGSARASAGAAAPSAGGATGAGIAGAPMGGADGQGAGIGMSGTASPRNNPWASRPTVNADTAAARTAAMRSAVAYGGVARIDSVAGQRRSAVPPYSRPGGVTVGTAVPRGSVPPKGALPGSGYGYVFDPWMYGGYGGMLGYGAYDLYGPFGFGYGDAFGLGFGGVMPMYGSAMFGPIGYDPYAPSDPADSTFVPLGSDSSSSTEKPGGLRLKVKPDAAAVYVDGEYVGAVRQFDGLFHKLHLDAGNHAVELRAPGYESLAFHVRIEADRTETYRGALDKAPR